MGIGAAVYNAGAGTYNFGAGVTNYFGGNLPFAPEVTPDANTRPAAKAFYYGTNAAMIGGAGVKLFQGARSFFSLKGVTNLASPSRTSHILAGDGLFSSSGGHAWFRSIRSTSNGIFRQKSMFPMSWSNGKIMTAVNEVATSPFSRAINQTGRQGSFFTNGGAPARIANFGTYDGITLRVITEGNVIKTAHPWFKPIP